MKHTKQQFANQSGSSESRTEARCMSGACGMSHITGILVALRPFPVHVQSKRQPDLRSFAKRQGMAVRALIAQRFEPVLPTACICAEQCIYW